MEKKKASTCFVFCVNAIKSKSTLMFPSWLCFCRYVYELEASTDAGSSMSSQYIIQTPVSSPEKIPAPYNVSVLGPRSVFVTWSLPGNVFTLLRNAPSLFSNHWAVIYPCFGQRESLREEKKIYEERAEDCYAKQSSAGRSRESISQTFELKWRIS